MQLEYVASQKGNFQLSCDGFFYVREKGVGAKTYWRCVEYTSKSKCHSRIHTMDNRIIRFTNHNHEASLARKKARIAR